jgi:hypothetical protein
VKAMTVHDSASFSAGQDCGTRLAACVARLAALELIDDSHWWNRRGHRLMAGALVACAEDLESAADGARSPATKAVLRSV